MLQETDYVHEGQNLDFFRAQLQPLDYVRVPLVHWDLTTNRILTMALVPGDSLPDYLARQKPSSEARNRIGARLLELFHLQVHHFHALHADPHPGNYLIAANGAIGLVDFGCVKKFSPAFIELMRAFAERIWLQGEAGSRRLARLIWGPGILDTPRLAGKLLKQSIDFYEVLFLPPGAGPQTIDFGDARIIKAMLHILNDCLRNKAVNPEFAFYARAELGLYNLLHLLRARIDTSAVLAKHAAPAGGRSPARNPRVVAK